MRMGGRGMRGEGGKGPKVIFYRVVNPLMMRGTNQLSPSSVPSKGASCPDSKPSISSPELSGSIPSWAEDRRPVKGKSLSLPLLIISSSRSISMRKASVPNLDLATRSQRVSHRAAFLILPRVKEPQSPRRIAGSRQADLIQGQVARGMPCRCRGGTGDGRGKRRRDKATSRHTSKFTLTHFFTALSGHRQQPTSCRSLGPTTNGAGTGVSAALAAV